jgi:signal transduction histidine kinase
LPQVREKGHWEGECQLWNIKTDEPISCYGTVFLVRYNEKEQPICMAAIMRDITERKRMEREILRISEREQRRIGQDLHDGLGQNLTAVGFLAGLLKDSLSEKDMAESDDALKIENLISETADQARKLARGLCPVEWSEEGLYSALEQLAKNTREVFGIGCDFLCSKPLLLNDNHVSTNLYYICREAVNNALKHAKAKNITIRCEAGEDRIILGVEDDGIGIKISPEREPGMGLQVMKYRADMIKASLEITPGEKRGTVVRCSLPGTVKQKEGGDGEEKS